MVIEFSQPEAAVGNIELALAAGVPVVVGTTGWLNALPAVSKKVEAAGGALFWASNFSVGVNVFFAAARRAAELLAPYGGYTAGIEETHHTEKLDAPSGTAITLAGEVSRALPEYDSWTLAGVDAPGPSTNLAPAAPPAAGKSPVPIHSVREPGVPGTHRLELRSAIDTLEISHVAHSREGFARGALTAARWLPGRKGTFTMSDLLATT